MIQIRMRQVYHNLELRTLIAWMSSDDFSEHEEKRFYLFFDALREKILKKLRYV